MKMNSCHTMVCKFCKIFFKDTKLESIDTPISTSDNERYAMIASLGSFIDGWSLLVPNKHIYSMKDCFRDREFIDFANSIIDRLSTVYQKKILIFEHGANKEGSVIACGTNHAHLHIVPYDKSILKEMREQKHDWIRCGISEISDIAKDNEYWFYAENVSSIEDVSGWLHIVQIPESQFFRKILAEKENVGNSFNYKEYPFVDRVQATINKLRKQDEPEQRITG